MSLLYKLSLAIRERELFRAGDALVVGVSGGPDSLALLHALTALNAELNLRLTVAHLNHQLRGAASDGDAEFVAATARAWGLPFAGASWDVAGYAAENRLSIEEAARNLRYQFLLGVAHQTNAVAVAVAHTADDQVETILLHFLRGAGLNGLRGMAFKLRLQSDASERSLVGVDLVRPFLDVTRDEIEEYCRDNELAPRVDESNADMTFLRNRVRHEVLPYLESINPNLRRVIRHSALSIGDDYAYVRQNVLGIFDRVARPVENAFVFDRKWFKALPVNLQRGVLREAVDRLVGTKNVGFQHIEEARRVAAEKDAGAEASLPQGLILVVGYDDFTLGEQLPLPDMPLLLQGEEIRLAPGSEFVMADTDWVVRVPQAAPSETANAANADATREVWRATFDAQKIVGQLVLRTRRAGERFAPEGMGGKHKSLHEFMIDSKIPRHVRELTPILADDEKVLWVVGYRRDGRALPTAATSELLTVAFVKASWDI